MRAMRHNLLYSLFTIVIVLGFASCNKESELQVFEDTTHNNSAVDETPDVFQYTFIIAGREATKVDTETKSLLGLDSNGMFLQWESTDRLKTWADLASGYSANNEGIVNAEETPVTFTITSSIALEKDANVYCAYGSSVSDAITPTPTIDIPANQEQTGEVFNAVAMPMVAEAFPISKAIAADGTSDESGINFYNLGGIIEFDIYSPTSTYKTELIKSVTFKANENIVGSFSIDLTAVNKTDVSTFEITGYSTKTVTTEVSSLGVGASAVNIASARKVYMVVAPGDYTGDVVVTTNLAEYKYTISTAKTINRSEVKRFGVNLEKDGARYAIKKELTFSHSDFQTGSYKTSSFSKAVDGDKSYSISYTDTYQNASKIQLKANSGEIHNTTALGKIVSLSYTSGTNTVNVYFGTSVKPSTAANVDGTTCTPKGDNDTYFNITSTSKYATINNVVVTYIPTSGKANPGLSYAVGDVSMNIGDNYCNPITNPYNLNVSYESSNTSIATVASDGTVSAVAEGSVTITASYAEDSDYNADSAEYTLNVNDPDKPTLVVSPSTTSAEPFIWPRGTNAGQTFTVTADNGGSWDYSGSISWANITKDATGITITPKSADSATENIGNITITLTKDGYSDLSSTIYVKQLKSSADPIVLSFPDDNSSNNGLSSGQYTSTWTAKKGDFGFSISNFNNNNWNGSWSFIRCGRNGYTSVATITTDQVDFPVTSIEVVVDTYNTSKGTATTQLEVASDSAFGDIISTVDVTMEAGTLTYSVPSENKAANLYYRITYDCASGTGNGFIQVSKVTIRP